MAPFGVFFYVFYPFAAVGVVGLKIPTGVVEPLGPCERQQREHLVYVFRIRRCLPLVYRLSHSLLGLLQIERLAIHVYANISGTYVHNLQRTTSTAFCRFSCVLCARCLPVLPCHRAHRYPKDEQRRQLAHSTTRGQW